MSTTPRGGARAAPTGTPLRTCVACRQVRPQGALLRLTRTADGRVEPDPGRRRGGRGAYVCRDERCVGQAVRRGRWAQAFRAPAMLPPETAERLYALARGEDEGSAAPVGLGASSALSVKGGW